MRVIIKSCSVEYWWYRSLIGETVDVDTDSWYVNIREEGDCSGYPILDTPHNRTLFKLYDKDLNQALRSRWFIAKKDFMPETNRSASILLVR